MFVRVMGFQWKNVPLFFHLSFMGWIILEIRMLQPADGQLEE